MAEWCGDCKRCEKPVFGSHKDYHVFERMHWECFHFEFEHDGPADVRCDDPSCPVVIPIEAGSPRWKLAQFKGMAGTVEVDEGPGLEDEDGMYIEVMSVGEHERAVADLEEEIRLVAEQRDMIADEAERLHAAIRQAYAWFDCGWPEPEDLPWIARDLRAARDHIRRRG